MNRLPDEFFGALANNSRTRQAAMPADVASAANDEAMQKLQQAQDARKVAKSAETQQMARNAAQIQQSLGGPEQTKRYLESEVGKVAGVSVKPGDINANTIKTVNTLADDMMSGNPQSDLGKKLAANKQNDLTDQEKIATALLLTLPVIGAALGGVGGFGKGLSAMASGSTKLSQMRQKEQQALNQLTPTGAAQDPSASMRPVQDMSLLKPKETVKPTTRRTPLTSKTMIPGGTDNRTPGLPGSGMVTPNLSVLEEAQRTTADGTPTTDLMADNSGLRKVQDVSAASSRSMTPKESIKLVERDTNRVVRDLQSELKAANKGKPLNDAQSKSFTFATRMDQANEALEALESNPDFDLNSITSLIQTWDMYPTFAKSSTMQQYDQAKANFLTAVLRKESGAAISDSEFDSAETVYFPQPYDSPEVIEQKRQTRALAIQQMKASSGLSDDIFETAKTGIRESLESKQNSGNRKSAIKALSREDIERRLRALEGGN